MRPVSVTYVTPGRIYTDDDDGDGGLVPYAQQERAGLVRRGNPAFVAADPKPIVGRTVDAPAWLVERQPLDVGTVWTPTEGAHEQTSAMDRAKALRVRLVPWLWAWAGISAVIGVAVLLVVKQWPLGALLALLLFAVLTAVTYYRLNWTDYAFSREGTERHRLDTAADLARRQMTHEHELRRMALETYLRTLEKGE